MYTCIGRLRFSKYLWKRHFKRPCIMKFTLTHGINSRRNISISAPKRAPLSLIIARGVSDDFDFSCWLCHSSTAIGRWHNTEYRDSVFTDLSVCHRVRRFLKEFFPTCFREEKIKYLKPHKR